MYGGNANFYNLGLYEYSSILDALEQMAAADTWIVPSAGPDFGKLLDQARVLRTRAFPTAMVLPQTFPATPQGCERAIRLFAESFGRKVIVYVKADDYLAPTNIARLVDSGLVSGIKYSIVRHDPKQDEFLTNWCSSSIPQSSSAASASGLRSPTCAISGSAALRRDRSAWRRVVHAHACRDQARALGRGRKLRAAYLPLEDARDAHSPIRVLHDAVTLAASPTWDPSCRSFPTRCSEHQRRVKRVAALLAHDRALLTPERTAEEARRAALAPLVRRQRPALVRPSFAHRADGLFARATTPASRSSRSSTRGATSTRATRISASAPRR